MFITNCAVTILYAHGINGSSSNIQECVNDHVTIHNCIKKVMMAKIGLEKECMIIVTRCYNGGYA